jgi:hypothetical protein
MIRMAEIEHSMVDGVVEIASRLLPPGHKLASESRLKKTHAGLLATDDDQFLAAYWSGHYD